MYVRTNAQPGIMYFRWILMLTLLCSLGTHISFGQTVAVGNGSYSTSLPSGEIGPQNFSGSNVSPKISATFDQPIQTNDYWSSLIYPLLW